MTEPIEPTTNRNVDPARQHLVLPHKFAFTQDEAEVIVDALREYLTEYGLASSKQQDIAFALTVRFERGIMGDAS